MYSVDSSIEDLTSKNLGQRSSISGAHRDLYKIHPAGVDIRYWCNSILKRFQAMGFGNWNIEKIEINEIPL